MIIINRGSQGYYDSKDPSLKFVQLFTDFSLLEIKDDLLFTDRYEKNYKLLQPSYFHLKAMLQKLK